ncbi:leucine-rich repeat neuronal protein 3-like [Palaemon carinicauda]|uniref:leucine-rich repeat neuronal protein 3-like n=1 Tax=Palaemon carinicauda TaxID=392227 RepID=UPI0035B60854
MKLPSLLALLQLLVPSTTAFLFAVSYTDICDDLCTCPSNILEARHQMLDCSDRNISSLPENIKFPEEVTGVDFTRNRMTRITTKSFSSNRNLLNIDFSDNELRILLGGAFQNLPNLQSLVFKNNKLSDIHGQAFAGLANLTKLDLSYNELTSLPEDVFAPLSNLQELILNFNQLAHVDKISLAHNPALRKVHLSSLGIRTLHPHFFPRNLTKLDELSLAFNDLAEIPVKALHHIKDSLKDLDVSGNPIKDLGAYSFYGLKNLKNLRLDQMLKLETIDAFAFGDLTHLETCTLRYMPRISYVDEMAFYGNKNGTKKSILLRDFTFSFSMLSTLPEKLLDWSRLRYVDLRYNKWHCDCNMRWIKNSTLLKLTGSKMVCSSPKTLTGKPITRIPEDQMTCSKPQAVVTSHESLGIIIGILIAGIGVSLGTVAFLVYRRHGWLFVRPQGNYAHIDRGAEEITVIQDVEM